MKSKLLLLAIPLAMAQGCSLIPAEKEQITIRISDTEMKNKSISFTSSLGSFGYSCSNFDSDESHQEWPEFNIIKYKYSYGSTTIQMGNIKDIQKNNIDLSDPMSLKELSNIDTIYVDWKGIEKSMPQYELHYDKLIVQTFIDDCIDRYRNDRDIIIEKRRKDMIDFKLAADKLASEAHQNMVTTSINNALKKHNKKSVSNGGELSVNEVLLNQRYQNKVSYRNFLNNKNKAYAVDFSGYRVSQILGNNQYILRNIIEDFYVPGLVPPLPIILKTKKQLFEGDTPTNGIAIYTGIELHQTISGVNKQFVSLTSLD